MDRLERAYEELRYGLALPPPRATDEAPLTFLRAPGELEVQREDEWSRGFDRSAASCQGAELDMEAARRCVAEAAIVAQAPATASWLRAGYAAYVARELGAAPTVNAGLRGADEHPELGVLSSTRRIEAWRTGAHQSTVAFRSAHFFAYMTERSEAPLGHAGFLGLSLAATRTAPGALRYEAEPDLMDVLSATMNGDDSAVARFIDDFARYRFFESPRSWGARPEGFVDWVIDGATLPRSVVTSRPIEPTGSVYVQIDLTVEQRKKTIAVQTSCESPVSYVWSVLRIGEGQRALAALPIGYLERGARSEARVEAMDGVRQLVIVGTNMDGVDLAHPFDPDHGPHESHGCQVYVSVLQ